MYSFVPGKLPPEKYRQVVEELAGLISDPVDKLKFLKQTVENYRSVSSHKELDAIMNSLILNETEPARLEHYRSLCKKLDDLKKNSPSIDPFTLAGTRQVSGCQAPFLHPSALAAPAAPIVDSIPSESLNRHSFPLRIYSRRYLFISIFLFFYLFSGEMLKLALHGTDHARAILSLNGKEPAPMGFNPVSPSVALNSLPADPLHKPEEKTTPPKYLDKQIWLVEKNNESELYSNRLKIITTCTTANIPRRYYCFERKASALPDKKSPVNRVAGILYHASESDIVDFKPEMNESINEYSRALIRYLRKKKAYHYIIDRFGRVYRLVQEDHAAYHGGQGVWADETSIYLNLNHAFIGICFEGKDFETRDDAAIKAGLPKLAPMEKTSINEAQLISGKELTDWLRVKYKIPQGNCVPHCLTSINPHNLLIGHHLDLSRGFPFRQYGLTDKYLEPLPAITEFGLSHDRYFTNIFNGSIWPGIGSSKICLQRQAAQHGISLARYKRRLNKRFVKFYNWQMEQE